MVRGLQSRVVSPTRLKLRDHGFRRSPRDEQPGRRVRRRVRSPPPRRRPDGAGAPRIPAVRQRARRLAVLRVHAARAGQPAGQLPSRLLLPRPPRGPRGRRHDARPGLRDPAGRAAVAHPRSRRRLGSRAGHQRRAVSRPPARARRRDAPPERAGRLSRRHRSRTHRHHAERAGRDRRVRARCGRRAAWLQPRAAVEGAARGGAVERRRAPHQPPHRRHAAGHGRSGARRRAAARRRRPAIRRRSRDVGDRELLGRPRADLRAVAPLAVQIAAARLARVVRIRARSAARAR